MVGTGQVRGGERHYIAFLSTAPDQVDIYFQGAFLGSTNASFTAPPLQAIFFRDDTSTGREEQLDAVVEALRISGVGRTAEEIAAVQQNLEIAVQLPDTGGEPGGPEGGTDGGWLFVSAAAVSVAAIALAARPWYARRRWLR